MSRRSERRRRLLQRSQKFSKDRIRDAREKLGLDESHAPLETDFPDSADSPENAQFHDNHGHDHGFSPDRDSDYDGNNRDHAHNRDAVAGDNEEAPDPDLNEIGRAPGELPAASPFESEGPTRFRVLSYSENAFAKEEFSEIDRLMDYADRPGVTWVQMLGITDPEIVHIVGAVFNIPMLAQEDVLAVWSRAKFDEYGEMILAIASAVRLNLDDSQPRGQQISFLAGKHFVISFHENDDHVFEAVERRLEENTGRQRRWGAGYLFYALFDTLVDRMLYLAEEMEDAIGELEDRILTDGASDTTDVNIHEVYHIKRIAVRLSRIANPLRETIHRLARSEHRLLDSLPDMYFADLNDHAVRVGDRVEHARAILQDLQDYHHMLQERKTNEIIKVLTVVSSIFIPLTFVAGVYGMNYKEMPELNWRYGYPICLAGMALFAFGMFAYFRRKKWI
jgi:magnesium transporter